jgi:hypothetical protein
MSVSPLAFRAAAAQFYAVLSQFDRARRFPRVANVLQCHNWRCDQTGIRLRPDRAVKT